MLGNYENNNEPRKDNRELLHHSHKKEYEFHFTSRDVKLILGDDETFVFYDMADTYIGKISVSNIIRYIIGSTLEQSIIDLIEMSICVKKDKSIKKKYHTDHITLVNKSPFLNNIEIMVVLNRWFRKMDMSIKNMTDIEQRVVRKFICLLLEHTLRIISLLSKTISHNCSEELKKKLLRYSSEVLFRLTTITNSDIDMCIERYNKIQDTSDKLNSIEQKLQEKIRQLEKKNIQSDNLHE